MMWLNYRFGDSIAFSLFEQSRLNPLLVSNWLSTVSILSRGLKDRDDTEYFLSTTASILNTCTRFKVEATEPISNYHYKRVWKTTPNFVSSVHLHIGTHMSTKPYLLTVCSEKKRTTQFSRHRTHLSISPNQNLKGRDPDGTHTLANAKQSDCRLNPQPEMTLIDQRLQIRAAVHARATVVTNPAETKRLFCRLYNKSHVLCSVLSVEVKLVK